jgi:hypothetical protein
MNVNVIGSGTNSDVQEQIDRTHFAGRVTVRPVEHNIGGINGGHYSIGSQTGVMAAGIASLAQVYQIRWADPTRLMVVKKLTVQVATLTAFGANLLGAPLELILGHGSTANGSGGTALAPSSSSNKLRASMGTTAFATSGEIRIATTAALTAATGQTLEAAPITNCAGAPSATVTQSVVMNLFERYDTGAHPLILNAGDTFTVRTNTPSATGTWTAFFTMEWVEVVAY